MKRGDVSASSSPPPKPKRSKAGQACASCRKSKTRCVLLDSAARSGTLQCRRCSVNGVSCSYAESDIVHLIPNDKTTPIESQSSVPQAVGWTGGPVHMDLPRAVSLMRSAVPGDLLSNTVNAWRRMDRLDWRETPMLAVQEVCRVTQSIPVRDIIEEFHTGTDHHLQDILGPEEITFLRDVFDTYYHPWLCSQPNRPTYSPLLDLVRCTVASRHLDPAIRAKVAPRLQKLTEELSVGQLFHPSPSLETIEALIVSSLWSPICGSRQTEARDNRLVATSAVSMAMNLRLGQASERVKDLRAKKQRDGRLSDEDTRHLTEATDQSRLWMLLSTTESMLCFGTGRVPVSHRSPSDYDAIDASSCYTLERARDVRLKLMGKLFEITEDGFLLRLENAAGLNKYYSDVMNLIGEIDSLHMSLASLSVISSHDPFYFHIFKAQFHCCRLLVLHHVMNEIRIVFTKHPQDNTKHWTMTEVHGIRLVMLWGRDSFLSTEAVLLSTLSVSSENLKLLATAPDHLFEMIFFSTLYLAICNCSMRDDRQLGSATDSLLAMTVERLNQVAHSPDHAPAKYAHLISVLLSALGRRAGPITAQGIETAVGAQSNSHVAETTDTFTNFAEQWNTQPSSDLFADNEFWESFLENLNSDNLSPSTNGSDLQA